MRKVKFLHHQSILFSFLRKEEEGRTFPTLEASNVVEAVVETTVNLADVDPNMTDIGGNSGGKIEQKKYYRQAFKKQWMTLPEFKGK